MLRNSNTAEVLHAYEFENNEMGIRNMNGTIDMIKKLYAKSKVKVMIKKWYRGNGKVRLWVEKVA